MAHISGRLSWYIGDWYLTGQEKEFIKYGDAEECAKKFNIPAKRIIDCAHVCRAFEISRRRENLTFGHHAEVANRDDSDDLLDWAEEQDASLQDLRAEKRRRQKAAARIAPPAGKYRVIYADPPWEYGDERQGLSGYTAAVDHYPTMSLDELCDLPIENLAHKNAVLFLWTTSPLNDEAFQIVESWGFEYKAQFVWDKMRHNVGHYVSVRHELLLICTRGSCVPDSSKLPNSVQRIKRGEHSAKPEEFYALIEEMYTSGPYIELFARNERKGWEQWRNQAQTT